MAAAALLRTAGRAALAAIASSSSGLALQSASAAHQQTDSSAHHTSHSHHHGAAARWNRGERRPDEPPPRPPPLRDVHVVGGHGGILGDGTSIYKPLQTGKRGRAEALFYETTFDVQRADQPPAVFMPQFRGIVLRGEDGSDGSSSGDANSGRGGGALTAYLVLEDITRGYSRPAIMDIKMGQQAWDEDASPAKVEQERSKYPTQQVVGFRFTGMRVPLAAGGVKERGRAFGYALTQATLGEAFAEYLHDGDRLRAELIPPLLDRLGAIRAYFAAQAEFRFYGSSLLFIYEAGGGDDGGGGGGGAPRVDVRMIDFAHVWPIRAGEEGAAARDTGYLLGLDSIMGYLLALQRGHDDGSAAKARADVAR